MKIVNKIFLNKDPEIFDFIIKNEIFKRIYIVNQLTDPGNKYPHLHGYWTDEMCGDERGEILHRIKPVDAGAWTTV